MIHGFNAAASGLQGYQNRLNVQANNIANVSTVGYKAEDAGFSDILYTNIQTAGAQEQQIGNGVRLSLISSSFEQGALDRTGRDLDFALDGEGFFCVEQPGGGYAYTRAGQFGLSDGYLVTSEGDYVLDRNLQRISAQALEQQSAAPGVFVFAYPDALVRAGDSLFIASAQSGQAQLLAGAVVKQGYLEASSADISEEMTKMIVAQRGFQANARMLQTADEIEETSNRLRA